MGLFNSSSHPREHHASRRVGLIAMSAQTNCTQFAFYWPSAFSSFILRNKKAAKRDSVSKNDITKCKFSRATIRYIDFPTFFCDAK